jgi:hypothetical protein
MDNKRVRHHQPTHHVHYYQLRPWKRQDSWDYSAGMEYRDGYDRACTGQGRGIKGIEADNGRDEGAQDHKLLVKKEKINALHNM